MTAAQLRVETNRPPILPVSPWVFVDPQGNRWRLVGVETQTPRDEDGKPTGVPVAVARIEPEGPDR